MTDVKTISVGSNFLTLLAVLFIGLKLGGVIEWSWLWVLAPLWIPWSFIALCLVILAVLKIMVWRGEKELKRLRRERLTRRL